MPNKAVKRRTPQKTRKGAAAGKEGQGEGRQRCNGGGADHPKVIANSVFALTLPVRKSYQVKENLSVFEKPIASITEDLLLSLNRSLRLLNKSLMKVAKGATEHYVMEQVLARLKSDVLPKGYSFEVNKDNNGTFFFTIYKAVSYGSFWHTFPIKPALDQLKKYPELRECFLDIIYRLIYSTGIEAWWRNWYPFDFVLNDDAGFADWFDNSYGEEEEEEKKIKWKSWIAVQESYHKGEAYQCMKALLDRKTDLKKMRSTLSRTRCKQPVIKWMKEALPIIESGRSITDYSNDFWLQEISYDGGVRLSDQAIILWDEDQLYEIGCEQVDAEWNNMGCQEPCNHFHLWSGIKKLDFSKLKEEEEWLLKVSVLNQNYNTYVLKDK